MVLGYFRAVFTSEQWFSLFPLYFFKYYHRRWKINAFITLSQIIVSNKCPQQFLLFLVYSQPVSLPTGKIISVWICELLAITGYTWRVQITYNRKSTVSWPRKPKIKPATMIVKVLINKNTYNIDNNYWFRWGRHQLNWALYQWPPAWNRLETLLTKIKWNKN